MTNATEELELLFNKPMEINLSEQRKGKTMNLSMLRTPQYLLAAVGLLVVGYGALLILKPDLLGSDPLKGMELTEAAHLRQIQRYCFNPVSFFNDRETCQLWSNRYVKLISGVDRELELFGDQARAEVANSLEAKGINTRKGWEAQADAAEVPPGNGKSPAY